MSTTYRQLADYLKEWPDSSRPDPFARTISGEVTRKLEKELEQKKKAAENEKEKLKEDSGISGDGMTNVAIGNNNPTDKEVGSNKKRPLAGINSYIKRNKQNHKYNMNQ